MRRPGARHKGWAQECTETQAHTGNTYSQNPRVADQNVDLAKGFERRLDDAGTVLGTTARGCFSGTCSAHRNAIPTHLHTVIRRDSLSASGPNLCHNRIRSPRRRALARRRPAEIVYHDRGAPAAEQERV